MHSNIPLELRALKQWVCWREGKVPYQVNGQLANVTEPSTWNSFDVCLSSLSNPLNLGVGFVFTEADPYSFIDLDNAHGDATILATHYKIAHEFDSYSEISPSGMGLHIIVKGTVTDGIKRSKEKIEIYSSLRYATMTGNVHNNTSINDYQDLITQLWTQMGGNAKLPSSIIVDAEQKYSDEEVIKSATYAVNGEKFKPLHEGQWKGDYVSQSEADLAYVDIIAFYSRNKEQTRRMWLSSVLCSTHKKRKTKNYVERLIRKGFDQMLPDIDVDGFKDALELKLANDKPIVDISSPSARNSNIDHTIQDQSQVSELPPGLLGELASFIYAAAPRPVPEVALAAAIGLMAGIAGRAYNISGTGLNQYVLLLAMTGAGKEAAASGINKLMSVVNGRVITAKYFIGPSEISSGSALFKYLGNTSQSFISLLGEFGLRLQQMSSPNANGSEVSLRRMFLDLYNKSGCSEILHASVYSDKANNTSAVPSPSFSILGESTPERFYGALNEDMISEGLLPRFLLIEYKGNRPPLNEHHTATQPSFGLMDKLAALCVQCEMVNNSSPRRVINVQSSPEASKMLHDFDKFADKQINGSNKEVIRQLWNRAHIKVLKLSALIAVGENMLEPTIQPNHMVWAANLVQADIAALTSRFEAGEIGSNSFEVKQANEIIRVIKDYVTAPYDKIEKYIQFKSVPMHSDKVIPYVYIQRRLIAAAAFRNDKGGPTNAMKRAIQNLVDADRLKELGKVWANEKYGTSQRCFVVADLAILD